MQTCLQVFKNLIEIAGKHPWRKLPLGLNSWEMCEILLINYVQNIAGQLLLKIVTAISFEI